MNNTHTKSATGFHSFYICLFLIVATISVYLQIADFEFVNLDDSIYVTKNHHVQKGLTLENITWALTAEVASNWHPLTLLSHMLDCQIHGLNSGRHHLTSLFFHIANTLLLFFVLKRMTGDLWQCAFVATLFALHPLHVESVAWVAERKDVLSTFFWILTMWTYIRYVERPDVKTYIPVLVFFALGLTAKPMLVTLPFVLILLDFWPLERLRFEQVSGRSIILQGTSLSRIIYEKVPLFALSAASCIVTYNYQQSAGAVKSLEMIPFYGTISNAFVSYSIYILKMIWPFNLAAFYPHPGILPLWTVLGALALLVLITFFAIRSIQRSPFFAVGWFWYLGTLVPVIGLLQVGVQSMADRYTYIPLIGLFIVIAWGVPGLLAKWRYKSVFLPAISLIFILFFIPVTWIQVQHWENSISLFEHALDVTDDNYFAHSNLALSLERKGRTEEALNHYNKALIINPMEIAALNNLGNLLARQGKTDEAIVHFTKALKIDPASGKTHINIGGLLLNQGKLETAFEHLNKALKICPGTFEGHVNMGMVLAKQGRIDEAIKQYYIALNIHPGYAMAHYELGILLAKQGKNKKAFDHLNAGLNDAAKAHFMMGNILLGKGEINDAVVHLQKALQINGNFEKAHMHLGYALLKQGKEDEAQKHCYEAIRIAPEKSINAYYNLACIYARRNEINESVDWLRKAIDKGFNDWNTLRTDKDLENIRETTYYKDLNL